MCAGPKVSKADVTPCDIRLSCELHCAGDLIPVIASLADHLDVPSNTCCFVVFIFVV